MSSCHGVLYGGRVIQIYMDDVEICVLIDTVEMLNVILLCDIAVPPCFLMSGLRLSNSKLLLYKVQDHKRVLLRSGSYHLRYHPSILTRLYLPYCSAESRALDHFVWYIS